MEGTENKKCKGEKRCLSIFIAYSISLVICFLLVTSWDAERSTYTKDLIETLDMLAALSIYFILPFIIVGCLNLVIKTGHKKHLCIVGLIQLGITTSIYFAISILSTYLPIPSKDISNSFKFLLFNIFIYAIVLIYLYFEKIKSLFVRLHKSLIGMRDNNK